MMGKCSAVVRPLTLSLEQLVFWDEGVFTVGAGLGTAGC